MRKWAGNPWAVLATMSLGFFMTLLDLTIVNIAIPDMIDGLGATLDQTLWVISGYALVLAVLLITAGRLGDVWGPRNLFIAGVVVFTAASIACGLATGPVMLIVARGVQGLGAALLTPQTMTLIMSVFPAQRRGTAMGIWGMVAGLATLSGPTVGGVLVSTLGWRWIFLVNVPIGIAALALAFLVVPDVRTGRTRTFDISGVLLATGALFCLTFALQEGEHYHWGPKIWGLLAAGVALTAGFLLHQRGRQDREPLVPFALFKDRNFSVLTVLVALVSMAMIGLVLPFNLYLQSVLGLSAIKAGLVLAPSSLVSMTVGPFAGRLSDRIGGKYLLMAGLALYAVGMAAIALIAGPASPWYAFIPATLITGLGIGCVIAPMSAEAMRNVEPRLAGAASGVNNTIRQTGSVIGAAAVGALLQSRLAAELAGGKAYADAFIATLHVTAVLPIAVVLAGALGCLLLRGRTEETAGAPAGAGPGKAAAATGV
ncbi:MULTISPECIES: DHA2 family efflux MFS transporter permease subunit [unclassified Streptomyces]|uniref:DHA2 family efflux MFS transporter permease subunit n=1 Tax=unclassified Streptomyces TaxID=2593676 RepID=UPI002E82442C|nr:DHA2 family efflux MFS transporter permease subunit [Streptomyces sp. NBC_00523]WUD04529.1 DHA2 family efflux MFS transporter permease subunit [Streptomyces sp. NBC_00523]